MLLGRAEPFRGRAVHPAHDPRASVVSALSLMAQTNVANTQIGRRRALLRRGEEIPVPSPSDPQSGVLLSVPLFHVRARDSTKLSSSGHRHARQSVSLLLGLTRAEPAPRDDHGRREGRPFQ